MTIGIYGLGRFGQFWGELLGSQGRVIGYNRSPRKVCPSIDVVDLPGLAKADIIFLCTAISSIPDVCRTLSPFLHPETLICDTCSVKLYPANEMSKYLPADNPIIPMHPMFGPDSANPENHDLPLVICPDPRGHRESKRLSREWENRFVRMGFRVITLTAEEHDRQAARTQGITHFIGRMLSGLELSPSPIATLGYKKIFEVMEQTCNDPWQLFLDLQRFNPYTRIIRSEMETSFRELMDVLETLTDET